MKKRFLVLLLLIISVSTGMFLAVAASGDEHVKVSLIADTNFIVPDKPFRLGAQLIMSPGWHTYYKEPGDAGMATKISWDLPPGYKAEPLFWEKPEKFSDAGITTYGYIDKTLIAAKIIPPAKITGKTVHISARIEYLACKELCVPGKATADITMNVGENKAIALARNQDLFVKVNFDGPVSSTTPASENNGLFLYIGFAFLGGILLNFMPCVLPVVAIKILNILEQTDKASARKATIAFAGGIFSAFLLLGLLVIGLQAAGHQVGWGFQFQQPIFLMVMSTLVLIFALSLFGLFDLSVSFGQNTVSQLANQQGLTGDFFKGVLATILSTPCTAPFLGTALGFAFTQSWEITLTIFASVGLGMCSPYFILIFAPGYTRFLPKPGDWMSKLKEAFGFVLLATTIWLVSVLAGQISSEQLIGFVYFLLVLAFAIWVMSRFTNLASSQNRLITVRLIAIALVACAAYFGVIKGSNESDINPPAAFDINALNRELNSGKTVFLDFTARWCLTCQVNESTAINTSVVKEKMRTLGVVYMKADWTRQDPTITSLLKKFGRSGVPLYVIFPGKHPDHPVILPELITEQIVLDSLDKAH